MKLPSSDRAFEKEISRWFVCFVDVMCIQFVILALSDILSMKCLTWVVELFYAPLIILLGLFFEEQTFLGNILFGLALLFLSMMIISVVIGTAFYLGNRFYGKLLPRKNKRKQDL